jgi:hypothetical protein
MMAPLCLAQVGQQLFVKAALKYALCPTVHLATIMSAYGVEQRNPTTAILAFEHLDRIHGELVGQSLHHRQHCAHPTHVGVWRIARIETTALKTEQLSTTIENSLLNR